MINISVIVTVLNEAKNLPRCLIALKNFDEVIVVDSGSSDETVQVASHYGARVESFSWKGGYPKKRQWCLDYIKIKHDYIFFVDADEEISDALIAEIIQLKFKRAGYFVTGEYCWHGKILSHGLKNNKLALFHKDKFEFPVVNDLGAFCMGEMEGHYQPILKRTHRWSAIGQLKAPLVHFAYEDEKSWQERHLRYAKWEAGMIANNLYPVENKKSRELMKRMFRNMPIRGVVAFAHSYIFKLGFLDGRAGYDFAKSRYRYYKMVSYFLNAENEKSNALKTSKI